jgi:hypothetical protein
LLSVSILAFTISYTLLIIGAKIGKNMAFFAVFQPTTKLKVGARQNFFKLFAFLPKVSNSIEI